MHPAHRFDNSLVHGAAAYSAYALGPFVHSKASLIVACLICIYAGWCRRAYLASFLGGVIVAVVGWAAVGVMISPGTAIATVFMMPFALLVTLPTVLAGYLVGKALSWLARRPRNGAETET